MLTNEEEECEVNRLKNFPISFLAICLGLTGFTLAWQKAEVILKLPLTLSNYLLYFSIGVIGIISVTYLLKTLKYPDATRKEFNHPVKLNFYPIIAKLFLITSIIYLALDLTVSKYLCATRKAEL